MSVTITFHCPFSNEGSKLWWAFVQDNITCYDCVVSIHSSLSKHYQTDRSLNQPIGIKSDCLNLVLKIFWIWCLFLERKKWNVWTIFNFFITRNKTNCPKKKTVYMIFVQLAFNLVNKVGSPKFISLSNTPSNPKYKT